MLINRLHTERGFTLIEILLIMGVMGILVTNGAPSAVGLWNTSQTKTRDNTISSVQDGIDIFVSNSISSTSVATPPTVLDGSPNGLCSVSGCFGAVLNQPIISADWKKLSDTQYEHVPTAYTAVYDPVTAQIQ